MFFTWTDKNRNICFEDISYSDADINTIEKQCNISIFVQNRINSFVRDVQTLSFCFKSNFIWNWRVFLSKNKQNISLFLWYYLTCFNTKPQGPLNSYSKHYTTSIADMEYCTYLLYNSTSGINLKKNNNLRSKHAASENLLQYFYGS